MEYSLEEHLNSFRTKSKNFALLSEIWGINKKTLPLAQNAINISFPHYSLHDNSHSDKIIKNIELFLGEKGIKELSPTDTFMFLMAAYTHDLGMIRFFNEIEELLQTGRFNEIVEILSDNSFDKDVQNSAQLIKFYTYLLENLKYNNKLKWNFNDKNYSDIDHFKKKFLTYNKEKEEFEIKVSFQTFTTSFTQLIAEYYRKNHAKYSQLLITGSNSDFNLLSNNLLLNYLPNRFKDTLGKIAFSHYQNYDDVLNSLEEVSNGIDNDYFHPRFVSILLRLGDLLDVDSDRFNNFIELSFFGKLPNSSNIHKEKHNATKHILVTKERIEILVDCNNHDVYREARRWFDYLEDEVKCNKLNWNKVCPSGYSITPPNIPNTGIKILYQGKSTDVRLRNLKFKTSEKKMLELIQGGAIYDKPGLVFIRETVQNSFDAIKLQLWLDILNDRYSNELTDKKLSEIVFPDDIPSLIWTKYKIKLEIELMCNDGDLDKPSTNSDFDFIKFTVKDNGIGIHNNEILELVNNVGQNHYKNNEKSKIIAEMPYFLKPTGAFGLGLQTLFLVAPEFEIVSKKENQPPIHLLLKDGSKNEYCILKDIDKVSFIRGTLLSVNVHKDNLENVFGRSFSTDDIKYYDFFEDGPYGYYLHMLKSYLINEFHQLIDTKVLEIKFNNQELL